MLRKLLHLFDMKEKKKLIVLLIMMIFAALFETLSISVIVPVVGIVTNPGLIAEQPVLMYIFNFLDLQSANSFIVISVVALILIFILKNVYLLLFHYLQNRMVLNQQVKMSSDLFRAYLTAPYSLHLNRNSAELLRNINNEVPRVFQGIILSAFQLLTEILVVSCILCLLFINAFRATLITSVLLSGGVLLFLKIYRKKTIELGKEQQFIIGELIKWVNQGLGASKEVKVTGKEAYFINSYKKYSQKSADNGVFMRMLDVFPRYFIETIIVVTILFTMLMFVSNGSDTSQLISTMALFAMSAFRLMPSISRILGLISTIRYSQPSLAVIYDDMVNINKITQPVKESYNFNININKEKYYKHSIELKSVSYSYPNQKSFLINNVTLSIPIGQAVAFIGESGAGKSTIVDIILGLYTPETGKVLVDHTSLEDQIEIWQSKIGYIPQNIYLSDDTIRRNIAFGLEEEDIDDIQVWRVLEQAQLKEFVEALPDKLNTHVGERGVRLSGGQRQRIGIARALYHDPEILFMDEATSALDNNTEKEIMKAIDNLKGEKTLIIIAHRLSTIENCDIVYKMSKGQIISVQRGLTQVAE